MPMDFDFVKQCIYKEKIYSMQDQIKAEMQEFKTFGNSVLQEVKRGNYKINLPKETFTNSDKVVLKSEYEKPKSKFKQFLSRVGNSFKNFFRWKEKN